MTWNFEVSEKTFLFHENSETHNESCEALVKQFILEKLNITQDITMDRVRRLGKPRGRLRPIVVKFHYFYERELIRVTAKDKSDKLKTAFQGVGVQQTKGVLQKRRDLSAAYDRGKAAGRTVK